QLAAAGPVRRWYGRRLLEGAGDRAVAQVGSGEERRPERPVDVEVRERIVKGERESSVQVGEEAELEVGPEGEQRSLANEACDREQVEDSDPEGGGLVLQRQGRSAPNLDRRHIETVEPAVGAVGGPAVPEDQTCRGEWLVGHRKGERAIRPCDAEVEDEVARGLGIAVVDDLEGAEPDRHPEVCDQRIGAVANLREV